MARSSCSGVDCRPHGQHTAWVLVSLDHAHFAITRAVVSRGHGQGKGRSGEIFERAQHRACRCVEFVTIVYSDWTRCRTIVFTIGPISFQKLSCPSSGFVALSFTLCTNRQLGVSSKRKQISSPRSLSSLSLDRLISWQRQGEREQMYELESHCNREW